MHYGFSHADGLISQDFLANELQTQFEKLSNQARFVRLIVNKELVVSNRKKSVIVAELRDKKFRPFPKVAKAKAAGETEAVVEEDEEAAGADNDYDYLLGMAIWSLTKEKVGRSIAMVMYYKLTSCLRIQIEKLEQQARDKEAELLVLLELTPVQIWNTDLDKFMAVWEVRINCSYI